MSEFIDNFHEMFLVVLLSFLFYPLFVVEFIHQFVFIIFQLYVNMLSVEEAFGCCLYDYYICLMFYSL